MQKILRSSVWFGLEYLIMKFISLNIIYLLKIPGKFIGKEFYYNCVLT